MFPGNIYFQAFATSVIKKDRENVFFVLTENKYKRDTDELLCCWQLHLLLRSNALQSTFGV